MKYLAFIVSLFFVGSVQSQTPDLMPLPAKYTINNKDFSINTSFKIEIQGDANERVYKEASRFFQRVSERTGLFFKTWMVDEGSKLSGRGLLIKIKNKGKLALGMDESYSLQIDQAQILLTANNDIGAIRGLATLIQLIGADQQGYYFKGIAIEDEPRFTWRGLLVSQPYHFMPMDVIKRTIDAMAAVKMNVLHFYISDDQGYRIESKVYPRLHQLASDGMYFSHEQVREMVQYADQRGIRVVPEIDVPGHSTAMIYAYPHLASVERDYALQDHWGVFDPTLDPTKASTYTFLDSLLTEVASLFPDQYFHIGGDENTGKDWQKNQSIRSFMLSNNLKTTLALQNYFNRKVQAILQKSGKITVGWDEVLMKEMAPASAKQYFQEGRYDQLIETNVPKDMVIQSWRGMEALLSSAKNGYKSILSKGFYIDLVQPASYHYLTDPIPFRNDIIIPDSEANFDRFESDIIKKIKQGEKLLSPEEEKLILGGEATMWTEHVSAETFDSRVWPRTAAIAERLWSPADLRNVDDMYRRMDIVSIQLESLGLTHIKNKDMMLRRLMGTNDITALSNLVQYLEPVQGYKRNRANNFTRFSPYTLMVDIAVPDQKAVRSVTALLVNAGVTKEIDKLNQVEHLLQQWIVDARKVQFDIDQKPALKDLLVPAIYLEKIAAVGINAIGIYKSGNELEKFWDEEKEELFKKAAKENGYCELKVVIPLKNFINNLVKQ
jgi:hexosaminidase